MRTLSIVQHPFFFDPPRSASDRRKEETRGSANMKAGFNAKNSNNKLFHTEAYQKSDIFESPVVRFLLSNSTHLKQHFLSNNTHLEQHIVHFFD